MAWPQGVTKGISEAMEIVYERKGIFSGNYPGGQAKGLAVKEEFKRLVSDWCVENPRQAQFADEDKNPEGWANFLISRQFWADAERNLEREHRQVLRQQQRDAEQQEWRRQNPPEEPKRKSTGIPLLVKIGWGIFLGAIGLALLLIVVYVAFGLLGWL